MWTIQITCLKMVYSWKSWKKIIPKNISNERVKFKNNPDLKYLDHIHHFWASFHRFWVSVRVRKNIEYFLKNLKIAIFQDFDEFSDILDYSKFWFNYFLYRVIMFLVLGFVSVFFWFGFFFFWYRHIGYKI